MKTDIYEQVTTRASSPSLNQGVVPWKSPYFSKVGFPRNFSTGRAYQGINVFLLGSLRFTSPCFLTFIQAKELGGHVRKVRARFACREIRHLHEARGPGPARRGRRDTPLLEGLHRVPCFADRRHRIPAARQPARAFHHAEKTDRAREIVAAMPNAPAIHDGSAVPCYRPGRLTAFTCRSVVSSRVRKRTIPRSSRAGSQHRPRLTPCPQVAA